MHRILPWRTNLTIGELMMVPVVQVVLLHSATKATETF